ncbi:MAG: restriction endonuclease subunit S [Melioribacteraceae bacterium]
MYRIKDMGHVITGKTPSKDNPLDWGNEVDFITPTDFGESQKYLSNIKRKISQDGVIRYKNMILPPESIIVTCIGSDMGKVIVSKNKALTNQQINSIIVNKNSFDLNFSYYVLKSLYPTLRSIAEEGGSTMPIITKSVFEQIEFKAPDLPTQKKIAEILSAYDEKIENNNKIIKNLELTAQTIFNEWFVNFNFPEHEKVKMVESDMEEIPEGWEVKSVLDVIDRISVGKKFENKTAFPIGRVPIIDQGASGFIGYHNEEPGVKASIENPVVVFTNHTCYYRLLTEPFSCIQNVLPYIGKNGYKTLFVYFLTKEKIKMSEYKGHWPEFEQQVFVIPPVELSNVYVSKIKGFIREMVLLEKENVKLKESRDQLLVKLI